MLPTTKLDWDEATKWVENEIEDLQRVATEKYGIPPEDRRQVLAFTVGGLSAHLKCLLVR